MFRDKQVRNRWHDKTKLEQILIVCVSMSAFAIVVLVVILIFTHWQTFTSEQYERQECRTPACLAEASRILGHIDSSQNVCLNFSRFACAGDENAVDLLEREGRMIEILYQKVGDNDDGLVLTFQRELYKSCINQTGIENHFKVAKSILATLGGWPVVQGELWKEANFDWFSMTYKLRQLGHFHNIFLGINMVPDVHRDDNYIFQVFIPEIEQIRSDIFEDQDPIGFLTDIAIAFGAETHNALREMSDIYQFVQDLRWLQSRVSDQNERKKPRKVSVAQFQHEYGSINWLQFINQLVGASAKITEKEYVLFPSEETLDDWFELLFKTPKRIQANYMFWRTINELLPYLLQEVHGRGVRLKLNTEPVQTRSYFCIQEIEKRFVPSPVRLEYVKVVTEKKRSLVLQLMKRIRYELLKVIHRTKWQDEAHKQYVLDVMYEMVFVVGMPEIYFSPDILKKLTLEQKPAKGDFLSMLAHANKNYWTNLYNLINKPVSNTSFWHNYKNIPSIWNTRNEISLRIPTYLIHKDIFDVGQVALSNYAYMGLALGPALFQIFKLPFLEFEETTFNEDWEKQVKCFLRTKSLGKAKEDRLLGYYLGLKLAYAAYQEELGGGVMYEQLVDVNYTSNQMFWISLAQQLCSLTLFLPYKDDQRMPELIQNVLNNDLQVLTDFSCSSTSFNKGCILL